MTNKCSNIITQAETSFEICFEVCKNAFDSFFGGDLCYHCEHHKIFCNY